MWIYLRVGADRPYDTTIQFELEPAYNRINKSWSSLSRPNKVVAVRRLLWHEDEARDLTGSLNLAAAGRLLASRTHKQLDGGLPQANEDPGLEYSHPARHRKLTDCQVHSVSYQSGE